MALHEFLDHNRAEILECVTRRIATRRQNGTDLELSDSLPELYDDLVATLRENAGLARRTSTTTAEKSATVHGRQRLRLGFTLTEVVHDYGAMCQAITEMAEQRTTITAREYQIMNEVLDVAIAAAVSEFSQARESERAHAANERERAAEERATERLGFVTHELRNALAAAMLSFEALRKGLVPLGGQTSSILERSLLRLQALVDRSLTEVRLKAGLVMEPEPTKVDDLLAEVGISTELEAESKGSHVEIHGDPTVEIRIDRQLMLSAITNLVQNAIKYSPKGAVIEVRCRGDGDVRIEVEDQCGGIDESKVGELFTPFVRGHDDGHGLGLGLAIARQAIEAHGGGIEVRNVDHKGCVFAIRLPRT